MAKSQTQKSRYPSKYHGNEFVTAAQYIVEIICEHKAVVERKKLPEKFWRDPLWEKFYKIQIIAANGLLRTYREEAIINALKSKKAARTYSLHANWLDDIIREEQHKIELTEKIEADKLAAAAAPVVTQPIESRPIPTHRRTNGKNSLLTKLRENNGEEKG